MALIGISGKIGSGKDTVGKILQALDSGLSVKQIVDGIKNFPHLPFEKVWLPHTDYKIKKFADKLKDITCMLIGCTREELENQVFKETPLGEEWWYYSFGSGAVKINYIDAAYNNEQKEEYKIYLVKLTPRLLLQLLGTDCGREIIHPQIWVNALFSTYKPFLGKGKQGVLRLGDGWIVKPDGSTVHIKEKTEDYFETEYPNWIITDMRFPNELEAVKKHSGITIRVNRVYHNSEAIMISNDFNLSSISDKMKKAIHPSETSLDNSEFDYVIDNNGSIEDLVLKVEKIWKSL